MGGHRAGPSLALGLAGRASPELMGWALESPPSSVLHIMFFKRNLLQLSLSQFLTPLDKNNPKETALLARTNGGVGVSTVSTCLSLIFPDLTSPDLTHPV